MKLITHSLTLCMLYLLVACSQQTNDKKSASDSSQVVQESPQVINITARGMRFSGPEKIPSGWSTFQLDNQDAMVHFGMIVKLPDGVSVVDYSDDLGSVFQAGYDAMVAGNNELAGEVFGQLPAWVSQLSWHGGPGFVSGNRTALTTHYLEPGKYLMECYIKTNGIFHSYSPVKGQVAMLLPFEVTSEKSPVTEPEANATLVIGEQGFKMDSGALKAGENTIRIRFDTGQRYPTFTGQDVHIIRLNSEQDAELAQLWMNWQRPDGLATPSPVTFLGGVNDLPAGNTAYITVDLSAGQYAFISEVDAPVDKGLYLPFSIE